MPRTANGIRLPDRPFESWMKGMSSALASVPPSEIASLGLNLLTSESPLPCAVIKETALRQNERWMQSFLRAAGVKLCPHGKTTMSPELFARQLAAGAWGITAATLHQLRVMRAFGVPRILFANQLIGCEAIDYVVDQLNADPTFEFNCLADSVDTVDFLASRADRAIRPLQILLEIGQFGGRTGVRDFQAASDVALAINKHACLFLAGLETYEYVVSGSTEDERETNITRLFADFVSVAEQLDAQGSFRAEQVILSAGGSAYLDLAAEAVTRAKLRSPVVPVIRSGCYLTYDHGWLPGYFERMCTRSRLIRGIEGAPMPALEVWGYVQSRPEATRAFAAFGKRDVSSDIQPPHPTAWVRPGVDPLPRPLRDGTCIEALNDQHAYLRVPADSPLRVGDMIAVGISHPCTTFDKWRSLLLVDDEYNIIGAISTWF